MTRPVALRSDAAARLAAALPDCLAGNDARHRLAVLGDLWPGGATGQILELRLNGAGAVVDASQAFLPEALPDLHEVARSDPRLARVSECLSWAATAGQPRSLWLEWDLPEGQGPGTAGPSLFLAPPTSPPADLDRFFSQALRTLGAGPLDRNLDRVLQNLPPGTALRQLGVMVARPVPIVRLVLDTRTRAGAEAVIKALCPDLRGAVSKLFALPGFSASPRLDLDLTTDGIGRRLSLELPSQAIPDAAMSDCLARLSAKGVVHPRAAHALAFCAIWRGLDPHSTCGLSHLKATIDPEGRIDLKAYIGLVAVPALILT